MTPKEILTVLRSVHRLTDLTCPYFEDLRPSGMEIINCESRFSTATYEQMLSLRFRRTGKMIYRPLCHGCSLCLPVRLNVHEFTISKSQKHVLERNKDTSCELVSLSYHPEYLALYNTYLIKKHGSEPHTEEQYIFEHHQSPFQNHSKILACYRTNETGKVLVALSYIDILPDSISSCYCVYDIEHYSKLSLGIFTMLKEIELCKTLGLHWYYPGFWVAGCKTMEYKANFGPLEYCLHGNWTPLTPEKKESIRTLSSILSELYNN